MSSRQETPLPNEGAERLGELVKAALEHGPEDWPAFLDEVCRSDPAMRTKVEALLSHRERARRFIEKPALRLVAESFFRDETLEAIEAIDNYEVLSLIGSGGMGAVYLARDRQLRRQVALKLVRQGLHTGELTRRFQLEGQILASLNHPNIARLYGAAVTAKGVPYLVMEYIEGTRLDHYCQEHQLLISQRLALFRKVCGAVAYAHQHLVIHRDIKPGNIRVTREGEPVLLDFGIAKLLDPAGSLGEEQTVTFAGAMTPEYASPEQVRGEAMTTASDVYSLGVLLYELLTEQSPYRTKTNRPEELTRAITEQEPVSPSSALLRSNSSSRSPITSHNSRLLRGDLDNIVLKAMRKEPQRRYESAAQFSEDIRRHLVGLPVIARKDTWSYRTATFIRRNRIAVGAAALILVALAGAVITTEWEARATREARARAESINSFLDQMLNYANPQLAAAADNSHPRTVTEVMDDAVKRLESGAFADEPEVRADLERIVATSYAGQGKRQLADEHIQKCLALVTKLYGKDHPKTLVAAATRARILFSNGKMAESEKLYRQILPTMRVEQQKEKIKAEVLADGLNNFAYLRRTQGDSHQAELLFRESLSLIPEIPKEGRYLVGVTQSTLASTLADQGKLEEALRTAQDAVAEDRWSGQDSTPGFGFSLTVLGGLLTDEQHFAEAGAALREAETIFHRRVSPSHLWLADNLRNQAALLYEEGRFAESLEKVSRTLDLYRQSFGTHYDNYPTALIIQGLSLNKTGRPNEGETFLREAVKLRSESLPKDHFWVALANGALGECLTTEGRHDEARPLLLQSYQSLKSSQGATNPRTRLALQRLITLYNHWGKTGIANTYQIEFDRQRF
ncbi:MAG TPA: serine/threonine-protein kinase [Chthoniobacterales bacterium]|jgi:serine/threonine-protein kinase